MKLQVQRCSLGEKGKSFLESSKKVYKSSYVKLLQAAYIRLNVSIRTKTKITPFPCISEWFMYLSKICTPSTLGIFCASLCNPWLLFNTPCCHTSYQLFWWLQIWIKFSFPCKSSSKTPSMFWSNSNSAEFPPKKIVWNLLTCSWHYGRKQYKNLPGVGKQRLAEYRKYYFKMWK